MRTRTRRGLGALTALTLLVAGCGDDDEDETTDTTAAADGDAAEGGGSTLDVVAGDGSEFTFSGVSDVDAGLVTVNLSNAGAEPHQAIFVQLNDGVTVDQLVAAPDEAAFAALGTFLGGPVGAFPGAPAESATVSLEPGEYALACLIPGTDGVPHIAKGMAVPLTVGEGEAAALEPTGETITGSDFAFELPDGLSGADGITFENAGEQLHEVAIFKLTTGSTVDDLLAFFSGPAAGPPPIERMTGTGATAPGTSVSFPGSLAPGEYVAMCFLGDPASGAPHFALGMQQSFTVT